MTHLRNNASNFYVLAIVLGNRGNHFNGQLYNLHTFIRNIYDCHSTSDCNKL